MTRPLQHPLRPVAFCRQHFKGRFLCAQACTGRPSKSGRARTQSSTQAIRRSWHANEWWFSVVDVCAVLTGSVDAGAYWRKLKQRPVAESGQPVTFCHGLKLTAADGRQCVTDCTNTEGPFRKLPRRSDCGPNR